MPTASPDSIAANQAGVRALQTGNWEEACNAFTAATSLAPALATFWNNLGFSYLQSHRLPEAHAALNKAIELDSEEVDAYFNLALCHEAAGDLPQAHERCAQFLQRQPTDRPAYEMLVSEPPPISWTPR